MMKELRTFYNQFYYAQNMSLVVMGAYTLDELEKHVVESFSHVPALPRVSAGVVEGDKEDDDCDIEYYNSLAIRREHAGTWTVVAHTPIQDFGMPFGKEALGRICRIVPVKDRHTLAVTWQLPPQWKNWKSKPCDYIAHLLGHEAAGSLLSALKEKSWVNECYAGVGTGGYENASSHALFSLTLTLSVEGVSHWTEILQYVYCYIGMVRYYCKSMADDTGGGRRGLPIWIYEELRAIQQVSYEFADETNPLDFVEDMADRLTPYSCLPPERLLDGDDLLFEFDNNVIEVRNTILNNFVKGTSR
jgi:secreted Zn-dependent insulinase-like peptidase